MRKKIQFLILIQLLCFSAYAELPEPYRDIEVLPFDGHGWYMNGGQLQQLIYKYKVNTIIEIGSWLGCSTRHMGSLLPPTGKVYAVDHWKGSVEHQPGGSAYYKALPYLYQQFLSNVIHAGLTDKIVPVRMSSLEAVEYLKDVKPDLIYIDAGHDTDSVYKDLVAWYPFVKGRGILCGDDWSWPTVVAAVQRFAQENNLRISASGNFWRLVE